MPTDTDTDHLDLTVMCANNASVKSVDEDMLHAADATGYGVIKHVWLRNVTALSGDADDYVSSDEGVEGPV